MTPKERAVMQQALECLEDVFGKGKVDVGAITALREALAEQSQQEPVAIADGTFNHNCPLGTPLYAAPVRTKDLTDYELQPFLDEWWNLPCDTAHDVKKIFRAVIAADRRKNK